MYLILIFVLQVTKCVTVSKSLHFLREWAESLCRNVCDSLVSLLSLSIEYYLSIEAFMGFINCFVICH